MGEPLFGNKERVPHILSFKSISLLQFDVLVALDLFAVHHEANRHCVPELGCEFSAFHDFYLRTLFCLAAESQLTHGA